MKIKDFVISIYPITSADVIEVKSLEQECNLSPWSIKDYYAEVGRVDSISLVAKVKSRVVGFIIARLISYNDSKLSREVEIYNICVAHNYRRNGVAQLLINELLSSGEDETNSIWLEVRESNKEAISFYRNLGFNLIGIRNKSYSNPTENGLIMKKSFG